MTRYIVVLTQHAPIHWSVVDTQRSEGEQSVICLCPTIDAADMLVSVLNAAERAKSLFRRQRQGGTDL
jgi:hypothetical protein